MLVFVQRASVFLGLFGPFGRFFTGKSIWRELCQPALYFPQMDFMTRISFDTVLGGADPVVIQRFGPFAHAVRLVISVSPLMFIPVSFRSLGGCDAVSVHACSCAGFPIPCLGRFPWFLL